MMIIFNQVSLRLWDFMTCYFFTCVKVKYCYILILKLGGSNICIGAFVCSSRNSISVSLYRDGIVFSYLIGYTNCV